MRVTIRVHTSFAREFLRVWLGAAVLQEFYPLRFHGIHELGVRCSVKYSRNALPIPFWGLLNIIICSIIYPKTLS